MVLDRGSVGPGSVGPGSLSSLSLSESITTCSMSSQSVASQLSSTSDDFPNEAMVLQFSLLMMLCAVLNPDAREN